MPSEAAALFRCCHRHRMEAARHVWGCRTKRHPGRRFQTGGRQSYPLFDKVRQAYCRAQPAQLPRAHLAANSEGVPALSPGTHPEGGEGRLNPAHLCCSKAHPQAAEKIQRKLEEGDSSPPSGHAALIRTKQGYCGKVSNWNGAGPCGSFLR